MPLLSIVIACLNDLEHLPKAMDSVLNQSFTDIELLVMDGASTDGTTDYLKRSTNPRLRWRSEPDSSLTEAWNKAIGLMRGDWVLFLGADDYLWDCHVVARAAPYLANSSAMFAFGDVRVMAGKGNEIVQIAHFDHAGLLRQLRSPKGLGLPHQGFFHNRRVFDTGLFDRSFRLAADYELITRFSEPEDFQFLPIGPVAAFRMGGISTKPWVSLETYREFRRIHRMRGRGRLHGAGQIAKAHAKLVIKGLLGPSLARWLVNLSRTARGMPPYT